MNKDSHKDFKDLDPDDVIYIDEDQRPQTPPPVVEDPKDVAPIRPKAPVFDLPLVEEGQSSDLVTGTKNADQARGFRHSCFRNARS